MEFSNTLKQVHLLKRHFNKNEIELLHCVNKQCRLICESIQKHPGDIGFCSSKSMGRSLIEEALLKV